MTQIDIAALVADREAGTKGPLVVSDFCMENSHMTAVAFPDHFGVPGDTVAEFFSNWRDASRKEYRISWAQAEANARRFARLDDLETALIAQDAELKRYRAALEFYADENRTGLPSDGPWGAGSNDFGKVARAAIGEKP